MSKICIAGEYEITAEHFQIFIKETEKFIKFFGLYDWRVEFQHHDVQKNGSAAECHVLHQGKVATLSLATKWNDRIPTYENLRWCAFHETCEILCADIESAARDPDLTPQLRAERLEREQHTLIRRLENCVLPLLPCSPAEK